ncbi:hypothetical protein NE664_13730, partial [Anaerotignum faecicola]|nr:hypothetical protein [Anaerotignum faecicola]
ILPAIRAENRQSQTLNSRWPIIWILLWSKRRGVVSEIQHPISNTIMGRTAVSVLPDFTGR